MDRNDITRYFLKGLETFPVPAENVTDDWFTSKDWIITDWNRNRIYVRLLDHGDVAPSKAEEEKLIRENGCIKFECLSDWWEMRALLGPIHHEIDVKSGAAAEREARSNAQKEKERREHEAALERKAERQRQAQIRRQAQLEKARLWHLEHDEDNKNSGVVK